MRGIKHVLTERYYAWEDAVALAEKDPEIDLSGNGPAYTPQEYLEAEAEEEALLEATKEPLAVESAEIQEDQPKTPLNGAADPSTIPVSTKERHDAPRM